MKKIKASKASNAKEQLKALGVEKDPEFYEISENDKKMFVVLLVKIILNPTSAKNDVEVTKQAFHKKGIKRLEERFKYLGYSKAIVLHNPENLELDFDKDQKEQSEKERKKAEFLKEMEGKFEESYAKGETVKTENSEKTNSGDAETGKQGKEKTEAEKQIDALNSEINSVVEKNKPEIVSYIKENEIDIDTEQNKEPLIEALKSYQVKRIEELSK